LPTVLADVWRRNGSARAAEATVAGRPELGSVSGAVSGVWAGGATSVSIGCVCLWVAFHDVGDPTACSRLPTVLADVWRRNGSARSAEATVAGRPELGSVSGAAGGVWAGEANSVDVACACRPVAFHDDCDPRVRSRFPTVLADVWRRNGSARSAEATVAGRPELGSVSGAVGGVLAGGATSVSIGCVCLWVAFHDVGDPTACSRLPAVLADGWRPNGSARSAEATVATVTAGWPELGSASGAVGGVWAGDAISVPVGCACPSVAFHDDCEPPACSGSPAIAGNGWIPDGSVRTAGGGADTAAAVASLSSPVDCCLALFAPRSNRVETWAPVCAT
jgi:hypothetical protein